MSIARLFPAVLSALAIAACSSSPPAQTDKGSAPAIRARGAASATTLKVSVEAVDVDKRLLTLRGPKGNSAQFKVADEVKRLSEIKIGDTILAEYRVAATTEFREPTAEEKASPLVLVEGSDRAPSDLPPGAAFVRIVRAVTAVVEIDKQAKTVTVEGPMGGKVAVSVGDAPDLHVLKVGQPIVVTFAESLLLTLQPGTTPR